MSIYDGMGFRPYLLNPVDDKFINEIRPSEKNIDLTKNKNCRNCGANWSDSGGKCVYCGTENK